MKVVSYLPILVGLLMLSSCNAQFWQGMAQGAMMNGGNPYGYRPYMGYNPIYTPTRTSSSTTTSNPVNKSLEIEDDGFKWYKTSQNGKKGAEDYNHNTLIPLSRGYDLLYYMKESGHKGYFVIKKNGKKGACDLTGKEVVEPLYESVIYTDYDGFEYKSSTGKWIPLGWDLDNNGRAIKSAVKSTLVEVFKYYSYLPMVNGSPDLKHSINSCEGVKFDFSSNKGKIVIHLMKGGYSKESMTITPSNANISFSSGLIIIKFSENGVSKAIQIIQSFSSFKKCIVLYDNATSKTGKVFGETGGGGIMALNDEISKYRGNDFDDQYRRIKNELERYTWNSKN